MSLKTHKFLLIFLLIFSFLVRFINLDRYPSLNSDEAAIGYNAYSLLQTGLDEHGQGWPLHFKSFGDYKPGGYFYLTLPFIKLMGLTPLAVRLPNLILSLTSIYIFYLLINLLFQNKKLALISAFVLALSPWHIHFSRGAWESNAALSFILLGCYFFLRHKYHLFVFFFSASLYTYHSARLVAPIMALILIISYFGKIKTDLGKMLMPLIFGILITLPVVFSFLKNGGTSRFSGVGLTADKGPISRSEELLNQHDYPTILNRIVHNKRVLYFISWTQKYVSHFDPNFLFINGDEVPRSKVPEMGQSYLIEFPFLILGLYFFIKSKKITLSTKYFLLGWGIIGPVASSLTFQAPSALRSLPLVIPLAFFIAYGLYTLTQAFKSSFLLLVLASLYIFSFSYYLDSYFIHYQKRYPFAWEYGFDRVIPQVNLQKDNYQNIFLTDTYDQPYIYYLFYSLYPPQNIQKQIQLTPPDQFGFSTVRQIDNIHFGPINWNQIPSGSYVIAGKENIPISPISTIDSSNGQPLFKFYVK